MIRIPAFAAGVLAGVLTPLWIASGRYRELLAHAERAVVHEPGRSAIAAAERTVRVLSRARRVGGPWRSTCLTRSVAACLALRVTGVPAVLRIGAARRDEGIAAHAWVESPGGVLLAGSRDGHTPLSVALS